MPSQREQLPEVSPSSLLGPEVAAVRTRHPGTWGPQTQRHGHPSRSVNPSLSLAPENSSLLPFLLLRQQGQSRAPPLETVGEGKSQERAKKLHLLPYQPQAPSSPAGGHAGWRALGTFPGAQPGDGRQCPRPWRGLSYRMFLWGLCLGWDVWWFGTSLVSCSFQVRHIMSLVQGCPGPGKAARGLSTQR